MLASGSHNSVTKFDASLTSNNVKSPPLAILSNIPLAPPIAVSRSGDCIASLAASIALLLPLAVPIPMYANPLSFIIELTSAKSKFIRPGIFIKSDIDCIPCFNTLSAIEKASTIEVFCDTICNNLSFGTVINVSTLSFRCLIPSSAFLILILPSNPKGLVTTPTVRIPISLAILATIGAAPVPVPPPIPAVTNTISVPSSSLSI